ncbi:MAG: hypothetical protein IT348_02825 [Candidatus Eisenbacteria bacterium]|nr:hypothetical protein [Candidatus Eisenbacteria bacterium]
MRTPSLRLAWLAAALLLLALAAAGCGKSLYVGLLPLNQPPEVELTQAPASPTAPYFYAYEMRWAGFDQDGEISHYLYAIDPPSAANSETTWVRTTRNREVFEFRSDQVDTLGAVIAHGYHTFAIKAVDGAGAESPVRFCAFNSFTLAPTVTILTPVPNHLRTPQMGPAFRVTWKGNDPDGRHSTRPVKYKYKVFPENGQDFDFVTLLVNPDSLRRRYAPDFSEWDSCGGDTTWAELRQLQPRTRYAFVVVAFDEAGAYSPVLNFDSSMLYFGVSVVGTLGPTMTIFNDSFFYQFTGGSFTLDETTFLKVDVAADMPLRFQWRGSTTLGAFVTGYRWRIDGDIADETPRSNETSDIYHWSQWSTGTTLCDLPPFVPPPGRNTETHYLYVEAKDNEDMMSLVVVRFTAIRPTFSKQLLILDDCRLAPDKLLTTNPPVTDRPRGSWPTAAELDTFLFARGGRQWKDYPAGTLSTPGLFLGYQYDTLATRFQRGGIVSLSQLGEYSHIVWYTDYKSSTYLNPPDYPTNAMPALHAMSYAGVSNVLAIWVRQGGKLWLSGGGAAGSLQREWEKAGSSPTIFSAADGELTAGRFMHDITHWRSEITTGTSGQARRLTDSPRAWPGAPSFARLPDRLLEKSQATDPISQFIPTRTSISDFYQVAYAAEAITKSNVVSEDADPDPDLVRDEPVLDTLYVTVGGSMGSNRPVMTLYHGTEYPPMVFSGFPLWYFRREQAIPIVDWVLQDLWGLPRAEVPR